jgi:hypothetical protein
LSAVSTAAPDASIYSGPRERKRHAGKESQRYANDDISLMRIDLDKRIHYAV